ncbi:MAG: glycosyltransferase family 9 protein [Candidatus Omnitrophica bacterium]|nr:glycosyltransferase family 9 protein [Candidatus Omnitrophota bacterium]
MRQPASILIVNPFGIGDVLFTTPLIRALRAAFPNSFLGYLCNRRTERILRHNTHLNRLFVYEKDELIERWRRSPWEGMGQLSSLIRHIRRNRFDLAIDLSLGERYSFFLALLGVARRIGFNYRNRGRFLNESFSIDGYHDEHVVDYYRRLLRFMGIHLKEVSLELGVSPEDEEWARQWLHARGLDEDTTPLVGIVPAGGVSWGVDASFRRWGFEEFAAVGDALVDRYGVRVLLFGEPADATVCRTVARLMTSSTIDASGQTTLGQFVSLLARLRLVICNDGGPLHLAVSQGVPTVSVFGPVDPRVYGPYPPSERHVVIYHDELPCRPCYHQFKLPPCPYERACLTTLKPYDVIEACGRLLAEHEHDRLVSR